MSGMPQQQRHLPPIGRATEGQAQGSTVESATRLMSESDRASFGACRAPLHRSTGDSHRPAANVELYSSTAL